MCLGVIYRASNILRGHGARDPGALLKEEPQKK